MRLARLGRSALLPVVLPVAVAVTVAATLAAGWAVQSSPTGHPDRRTDPPHSVIMINGDGMGVAQRTAARLFLAGRDGRLAMDELPAGGLLSTDPADPRETVTDSAAGATAWATGHQTVNGAISVDPQGRPLTPLGLEARRAGKATGLVTTAQVTDASPAAFFASTPDRNQQDEIARQYLDSSRPDVILGGGEDRWYPTGDSGAFPDAPAEDPTEKSTSTKGNLVAAARSAGYDYVTDTAALRASRSDRLLGLFANEEMFQQHEEGQGDVYAPVVPLADMTRKALDVLDRSRSGFFLFVEEEGIDEFAHHDNATRVLQALAELDRTVALVHDYAARHPGTLVVVAGDHETGGLTLEDVKTDDESGTGTSAEDGPFPVHRSPGLSFVMDWTTTEHTAAAVPVTAFGPGAERLSGAHPNTTVHTVLRDVLLSRPR